MNKRNKKLAFNIIVIIALATAIVWVCSHFIHLGNVEFTDNAQVRQHIVPINSRVQGFIKKIYFTEYQNEILWHSSKILNSVSDWLKPKPTIKTHYPAKQS